MYEATIFEMSTERMYTVSARTAKEAITLAWRAAMQDQVGEDEDVSTWQPDGLRVTSPSDEQFKNLMPLPDATDLAVIVDRGRMTTACGFVREMW
ncbi:hypothetical protein LCGC14_1931300 [marine sediment metagenome]|uniref:Uncharacterized protein n=1 Tax=marine sediment metagenome TaxID=412755 RepID=A0A0F9GBC6_9ZZZZ